MTEIVEIFDIVDTPSEAFEQREKVIDKRRVLKDALRLGKAYLLPKKCSEGFVDKAPDEAIDKVYSEFVQRELHEKGEKTAKALSTHLIHLYCEGVSQFAKIESVEGLRKDIENDPIIKDSMTDLGILVYTTFGKYLSPLLVTCHTFKHLIKKDTSTCEKDNSKQENDESTSNSQIN